MTRVFTHQSEVGRCCHESHAKMVLPDSIHHDSSGQRVGRIDQPSRQFSSATPFANRVSVSTRDRFWEPARNGLAGLQMVATKINMSVAKAFVRCTGWSPLLHHHGTRNLH